MGDALLQDIRYAFRQFRQSPGFAVSAVLTLALGIGANTAVFTILNALVLQDLPIKDPDGLVGISGRNALGQERLTPITAIDELNRTGGPLEDLCAYHGNFVIPVEANVPSQATLVFVTRGCFRTLGVTPILGRSLTDDDALLRGKGRHVAVISHRFWTRGFGADPAVVGRTIRGEGLELTVVGVLPPGFGGLHVDTGTELFVPFDTVFPVSSERRPHASWILGRLRPGITMSQAASQLDALWTPLLEAALPTTMLPTERTDLLNVRPRLERMGTGLSGYRNRYQRALTMILGLTGLLLLLACINLGGLLLARLSARRSELALRMALGGTRRRLAQQMFVDSLLLSLVGAVLAVPMSFAFIAPAESFMSVPYMTVAPTVVFEPDLRVLAVTALAGVAAGVLMTVLPIWLSLRRQRAAAFMWDRTIVRATSHWTRGLLVAQIGLSVVMLIGAGLLARSVYLLQRVELGVKPEGVLTVRPVPNGYRDIDNQAHHPPLLERIATLPGVTAAGFGRMFPYRTSELGGLPIAFVGDAAGDVVAHMDIASPGFFETLGIPLLAGRLTSWADNTNTRPVAVVSESLARALAPNGDVVGRRVRYGSDREHQDVAIVGVVGNATQGNPRRSDPPVIYRPVLQWTRYEIDPIFVIGVAGNVTLVVAGVRQLLADAGREYLHGALAYSVSRRTREIGVHLAIGATPAAAARTVMRESVVITLIGVAIGLPVAWVAARGLRVLMYGISDADPFTFIATAAFFIAFGAGAGVIPARRAARVDPMVALRAE
jgi:predicted permease